MRLVSGMLAAIVLAAGCAPSKDPPADDSRDAVGDLPGDADAPDGSGFDATGTDERPTDPGPSCPPPKPDPVCGVCYMELAWSCGDDHTICFCGNDACGQPHASRAGTCTEGQVCHEGQCIPRCDDDCDPAVPATCQDDAWTRCDWNGACYKTVVDTCWDGYSCLDGACQPDPPGPGDLGMPCADDAECRSTCGDDPKCGRRMCLRPGDSFVGLCTLDCGICKEGAPCSEDMPPFCEGFRAPFNPVCGVKLSMSSRSDAAWLACAGACSPDNTLNRCPPGLDCRAVERSWSDAWMPGPVELCVPSGWPELP